MYTHIGTNVDGHVYAYMYMDKHGYALVAYVGEVFILWLLVYTYIYLLMHIYIWIWRLYMHVRILSLYTVA